MDIFLLYLLAYIASWSSFSFFGAHIAGAILDENTNVSVNSASMGGMIKSSQAVVLMLMARFFYMPAQSLEFVLVGTWIVFGVGAAVIGWRNQHMAST